jgi:antitoxin component YwqK of YwqJK toxin-antitoxin module
LGGGISVSGQSVQVNIYPQGATLLVYEKFNLKAYQSKFYASGSLDYAYTESDGTQVRVTCQHRGQPIEVYITPPLPAVHRVFKEFYPNGNLKQKGLYLPQQLNIGKWLECDESGYCGIIDYEIGRGSFGYNGVLKTLEEKGYTGANGWSFVVWFNGNAHQWGVKLQKDTLYRMLIIDADSGEIVDEAEYEVKPTNMIPQQQDTYIEPKYIY